MKSPNWQEARDFVSRIAGRPDPAMTFQVFDDKTERYDLAAWKHGKLTDPAIRQFLQQKANEGCGIFVTISACDGNGRRRKNVKFARAAFIDMDGAPMPDVWPIKPDIINESSRGKYHAYWLLDKVEDLNAFSDLQSRLAAYFGGDPKVFDPPRVMRLPGFWHQKGETAFRSRTLEICDADHAAFERHTLDELSGLHPCDYTRPLDRADGGRSEEPVGGWDSPADVARARAYLQSVDVPDVGNRNNAGYRVAAVLNDFGISPELSVELISDVWNDRLANPLKLHEIQHVVKSAGRYKASSAGSASVLNAADDFDDESLDIPEENDEFDFENGIAAEAELFNFEGTGQEHDPGDAAKARPKTLKRLTGGVSWSYGSEVKAEALTWLWPDRVPLGKLTIIAGYPDNGKSQILLNIAATVTNGGEWPNGEGTCKQGVAIILSSEDDEADTLIPRLVAAGANLDNIIIVRSMVRTVVEGKKTTRVLNIEDDLRQIQAIMKQVHDSGKRVRMIGFDPINAYFGGAKKGDAYKTSDMRALLTPMKEWAATLKVAVVAISHFNKGGNGHTLYRITDSAAITASARSVYLALKKENDDPKAEVERVFVSTKHNLAAESLKGISYSITARDVSAETGVPGQSMPYVVFGDEDDTSPEEAMGLGRKGRKPDARNAAKDFLMKLMENGPVKVKDIEAEAKNASITMGTMRNAAKDLGVTFDRMPGDFQGEYYWFPPELADTFGDDDIPTGGDFEDAPFG